jgi:arginyl-tRNA synthetase
MIQAKQELLQALAAAISEINPESPPAAVFELPKQAAHGDFAITVAMQLARPLKKNPRELAQALVDALHRQPAVARWVDALEIAGPGFINLRLKPAAKQAVVAEVLAAGEAFGRQPVQADKTALVEFVSANPTGPLHVGHARQAALGDAICNLFAAQGWAVTREFYYNDAGVQIATLAASTQARLKGLKPGDAAWPESAYNGDYIADIANDFRKPSPPTTAPTPPRATQTIWTAFANLPWPTCATSKTSTSKPSACTLTTTSWSPASTPMAACTRR